MMYILPNIYDKDTRNVYVPALMKVGTVADFVLLKDMLHNSNDLASEDIQTLLRVVDLIEQLPICTNRHHEEEYFVVTHTHSGAAPDHVQRQTPYEALSNPSKWKMNIVKKLCEAQFSESLKSIKNSAKYSHLLVCVANIHRSYEFLLEIEKGQFSLQNTTDSHLVKSKGFVIYSTFTGGFLRSTPNNEHTGELLDRATVFSTQASAEDYIKKRAPIGSAYTVLPVSMTAGAPLTTILRGIDSMDEHDQANIVKLDKALIVRDLPKKTDTPVVKRKI